jgi:hypothetical protein
MNTGVKMTALEIAKNHFAKTNKSLIVQVRENEYVLTKDYFEQWEDGVSKTALFIVNPTKREKLGYRWVSTENISIKQEVQ